MVRKIWVWLLLFVLCITIQTRSHAQYFSKVYDIDSSADWGYDIFLKNDSSYFIIGGPIKNGQGIFGLNISNDGGNVISKKIISNYPQGFDYGLVGRAKKIVNNNYLIPFSIVWPRPASSDYVEAGGIAVLDSLGDTVFTRTYTDTSMWNEVMYDVVQMPDGGFLMGGELYHQAGLREGMLIRTDNIGNLKWRKNLSWNSIITSVELQNDGKILLGADSTVLISFSSTKYYYKHCPHFILADSANGNIIKDTLYSKGFAGQSSQGGGNIFKDKNGGYFHWGSLDTFYVGDPIDSYRNFWDYMMHLDDNFRKDWIKVFPVITPDTIVKPVGHKYIWLVKQTSDSGYILIGSGYYYIPNGNKTIIPGWAAKLDKNGNTVWDNTYVVDSGKQNYLTDGVEMPDGGFAFTGSTTDGNLPSWHRQDVWLLRVDANGCEVPGCTPTRVEKNVLKTTPAFSIYPNPATSSFTTETSEAGVLNIYNLQGQLMLNRHVERGKTSITLPGASTAGIYIARFTSRNKTYIIRLVYNQ